MWLTYPEAVVLLQISPVPDQDRKRCGYENLHSGSSGRTPKCVIRAARRKPGLRPACPRASYDSAGEETPEEIASGSDCRTEKCLLVCRVISYLHCGNTTYGKKLEKSRKELSTF